MKDIGCRSCLASAKMETHVANPLGAQPVDQVKVHLSSSSLFSGATILHLLPILGLLLGAFTGVWVTVAYGVAESFGSIGGAAAGLGIGYVTMIGLDRTSDRKFRRNLIPARLRTRQVLRSGDCST